MTMLAHTSESPFEQIKHTDASGDHWFARELMQPMEYPTWQYFRPVVERAMAAAANTGGDVTSHFMVNHETPRAGGPAREDFRLTRYGAYLVAMNGDPRKDAVAAAQTYFAVKTHEAETAPASPRSQIDVLRDALDQIEAAQHAAERAEATAVETSARLDAIEGRHDWFAGLAYAKLHGLPTDHRTLNLLGQAASRVGRQHSMTPNRVEHAMYGRVNQWPRWIWDEAAADLALA